jgi:hypothetical protein
MAGMTLNNWTALGVSFPNGQPTSQNLPADLLFPQGRNGPAFLAFPNFSIYLEWNQSFIYTTSAAYFATRLAVPSAMMRAIPAPGSTMRHEAASAKARRPAAMMSARSTAFWAAGTRAATRRATAPRPARRWLAGQTLLGSSTVP